MDSLGNPQNLPKSIHIAGTSGKTSTAYYVAALLMQAGKKVGLMTSPHITTINERVQINLEPLPGQEFCAELTIFMNLIEKSGITLTYAEVLYGFAYWEFARQRVDYIVVEVGMGGLLDATNIITRPDKVCVITDIGLDHTHVLGTTLAEITAHKAGIIRLHNPVFCHRQQAEVMEVVTKRSRKMQADLHVVDQDGRTPQHLPIFQQRNFSLALEAVGFALARENTTLSQQQIARAAGTHIPGRMETFTIGSKTIVIDTAHNAQKLHGLCTSIQEQYPGRKIAALVAFIETAGRDAKDMMAELKPVVQHMIITELPPGFKLRKSRDPMELATLAHTLRVPSYQVITDQRAAYQSLLERPEDVLLITGSTYLLEEVRPWLLATCAA